jgi:probable rRNA maturation factor
VSISVDVQYATDEDAPDQAQIRRWIEAALAGRRGSAELTVRIVDEEEGRELNERWRGGTGPTNVLSFTVGEELPAAPGLLGDIVICAPLVRREAAAQGKPEEAHWAHLVVHGALHLLGHDHADAREAEVMESLETEVLDGLGYDDPYHRS